MRNKAAAFFLLGLLLVPASSEARGVMSICIATIKRVELKSESGSWIKIIEPDREIDIENDPLMISFFNSGKVVPGKYTNFRIVISERFRVSGEDHGNFTKEGGDVEIRGTAKTGRELPGTITDFIEKSPTWSGATEGLMTEHLNLNGGDDDDDITIVGSSDLKDPIEIKKGSFVQIETEIHTGGCLYFASASLVSFEKLPASRKGMLFLFPSQIENLVVTVDGSQRIMPSDKVTINL